MLYFVQSKFLLLDSKQENVITIAYTYVACAEVLLKWTVFLLLLIFSSLVEFHYDVGKQLKVTADMLQVWNKDGVFVVRCVSVREMSMYVC